VIGKIVKARVKRNAEKKVGKTAKKD
jgi:hypothetical protein